jgi:ubiquinone biosynthesis protein UbiJ
VSTKENNGTPTWLDAVRRFERAVGVPIERFVTSDAYFDLLPHLRRTRAQLEELAVVLTDDWYRLLNVPSGNDVRQLREQLSRVERQVERLSKQVAARDAAPSRTARRRDQPS